MPQTILLTTSPSSSSESVNVTAYSSSGWLAVTPQGGSTPLVLTVSIGAGAPASGVDVGFVNIASGSTNLSVPVTLNVNSTGAASPISSNPNSLSFVLMQGSTAAISQSVALSTASSAIANFTATPITNNGASWMTVIPGAGSFPGNLQVSVNPVGLGNTPGTFQCSRCDQCSGNNRTLDSRARHRSRAAGAQRESRLVLVRISDWNHRSSGSTLTLSSSTGANVAFTATPSETNCGNWITLNQSSGATPNTLSIQVNTSGLTAQTCTGQINIAAPTASDASIVVPVTLWSARCR